MTYRLPHRTFCLIRHGQTTANRDGIIAGRLDVPLTDLGRVQGRGLQTLNWPSDRMLFTSPLSRAQDTCALGFPDETLHAHPDLRERNWGVFEGQPLRQLPPREEQPEGGEGWGEMIDRVAHAIAECCDLARDKLPVMICHSGVIRAARILSEQKGSASRPENAQPLQFVWTGNHHQETFYDI